MRPGEGDLRGEVRDSLAEEVAARRDDPEFAERLAAVQARSVQQALGRVMAVLERAQTDGPDVDVWVSALDIRAAIRPTDRPLPSALERPTAEERRAVVEGADRCPRCGWIVGTFECGIRHPAAVEQRTLAEQKVARVEALADDLVERLGTVRGLLSMDLEGAYQSGQPLALKQAISDMEGRVGAAWGLAVDIREIAAGHTRPSFEDMLRDPTQQLDPEGVVLGSILDYHALCLTPIPLAAPKTASVILPPTGSVYVCTKPKPCPEHAALADPEADR